MMLFSIVSIFNLILHVLAATCPSPMPIGCKSCKEETVNNKTEAFPYCSECSTGYTLNSVFQICDLDCSGQNVTGCTKCNGTTCIECADVYLLVGGKCVPRECVSKEAECAGAGTCTQLSGQMTYTCVCTKPFRDVYSKCADCLSGYTLSNDMCVPRPCTGGYTKHCSVCNADGTCFACKQGFFMPSSYCGVPCPVGCNCNSTINYLKCESCDPGYQVSTESGWRECLPERNCTSKPYCLTCDSNNVCLTCLGGRSSPKTDCSVPCKKMRGCLYCSPDNPDVCIQCIKNDATPERCKPYCPIPPSAGSFTACAEVYDTESVVAPYRATSFYNVRYSVYSIGFVLCNKLGYLTNEGICSCVNDPLRDPLTTCVECLPGYILDRYVQRCRTDTLNTAQTHCAAGDLNLGVCYTCRDGYYGVAEKCKNKCPMNKCLRCNDSGNKCIVCAPDTVPSDEGLCLAPVSSLSRSTNSETITSPAPGGNCTPECGFPFTCAKSKDGTWTCAHRKCVKEKGSEPQICGLSGKCSRSGTCICDDPHKWDFCSACAPGWTQSSPTSTCNQPDCFPKCHNEGTCQVVEGKPVCKCPFHWNPATNCLTCMQGYTGRNCNIPYCFVNEDCTDNMTCVSGLCNSDPCSSNNGLKCNGHGNCIELHGALQCVCHSGYSSETNCLTCAEGFYLKDDRCLSLNSTVLTTPMITGIIIGTVVLMAAIALMAYFGVRMCLRKKVTRALLEN